MSEMIGRVARAMFEADGGTWPMTDPAFRDQFENLARAAIEAMRAHFTPAMTAAFYSDGKINAATELEADPQDYWQAMIDAALERELTPNP